MRTLLFGIMLGAIAGVLYAPSTGARTRSIIKDKYCQYTSETVDFIDRTKVDLHDRMDEVNSIMHEQAGPLKDRMLELKEDIKGRLTDVRSKVEQKVGHIKEQTGENEPQTNGPDEFRQSA